MEQTKYEMLSSNKMKKRIMMILVVAAMLVNSILATAVTMVAERTGQGTIDVGNGSKVKFVSLDEGDAAAVMENGDLYCWGIHYSGEIGNGILSN